jgi:serine/threonine protein kinase
MQPSWQIKFWIETFLKRRPSWEGDDSQEFFSEASLSLSYTSYKSPGIPAWQIGDSILGRYKVLEIRGGPGKSGMGVVFIVLDQETGNIYAAKTLQDWCANNVRARKRFERESRMWIELENHPNIVKAHFLEQINDRPYLFLEFVPGSDVSSRVRVGTLELRLAIKFAIQICRAMSHAARRFPGFVHRDIKPSNCLTWQENLKLTDFGLAKAMDRISITLMPDEGIGGGHVSSISREGRKLGTLPYMAPELFSMGQQWDVRSDIYSFGVTLYKMVTTKLPFHASSPEEWMDCHLHTAPKDPTAYAVNLPPVVKDLILNCLAKNPEQRFKDFTQIGDLLSSVLLKDFGERLMRDSPQRLEVKDIINKAISYSRLGFHKEALDHFDRALAADEKNPDAWTGKAITLNKLGLHEEALECCDKAIAVDSYLADAWIIKGRIFANIGKGELAVPCFDQALKVRPEASDVIMEKGDILFNLKETEKALECYSHVTSLHPGSTNAWLMKALILLELDRFQDAIDSVNNSLKLEGGQLAIAWACKGDAYFRMGRLSKAEKCFTKALSLEPQYPFYLILLACTYVRMGQKDLARKIFIKAENLDPSIVPYLQSVDEYKNL